MSLSVTPTQADVYTTLRSFLTGVLPSNCEVIKGQVNRVPEPRVGNFVVMTEIRQRRLEMNVDEQSDTLFTGSIAGTTLTVSAVDFGTLSIGRPVFGSGVAANTVITALGTGSGGIGTYTVSPTQTITSRQLAAGARTLTDATEVTIQLDVHGDAAHDNSLIIVTAMEDEYGVSRFRELATGIEPLYCSDPRQVPFVNAEDQYEWRWVFEAALQVNATIVVPQQYAGALDVDLISVEATYQ